MKNETLRKSINIDKFDMLPLFILKESDNVILKLTLFKNSAPFDITGQTLKLGAKTSKGLIEQIDGFTINRNNLDIDLKNSILVPGAVEIDLELKDVNGTMTTASFFIIVKPKVLNDKAVEGTNEFDTFTKTAAKIEEDYKGLRRIIIDENQAANLQDQVNKTNAQLEHIALNVNMFKNENNTWNEAFEMCYNALPINGGTILITDIIEINRSLDLISLGNKKIKIEGKGYATNYDHITTSMIVKNGSFDTVIMGGGCQLNNITISTKNGHLDNGDGIWVAGLGCHIENVSVLSNGGNGIKVGNKNGSKINANGTKIINTFSLNNKEYGIFISDDTFPTVPNANACVIFGGNCRDNGKGGIKIENCIDNQIYSTDCEGNGLPTLKAECGIYIGANTDGHALYSVYTENHNAENEILLDVGSKNILVMGYRGNTYDDGVVDNGTNNLVIGRLGTKVGGYFFKGITNFNDLNLTNTDRDILGRLRITQKEDGNFLLELRGTNSKRLSFTHYNKVNGDKLDCAFDRITTDEIRTLNGDLLNRICYREATLNSNITINANSGTYINLPVYGAKVGDIAIVNPSDFDLPNGITMNYRVNVADNVKINFNNCTSSNITINSGVKFKVSLNSYTRLT